RILGDFLDNLGIKKTALVVHDIGGPIGLLWAVRNLDKLEKLVILNTLFYPDGSCRLFYTHKISLTKRYWSNISYPEGSLFLKLILLMIHTQGLRSFAFSQFGISQIMRMGVENKEVISKEVTAAYQSPFNNAAGGQLLNKTFLELQLDELDEIMQKLHTLKVPVFIVYGEKDSVLPGLPAEMHRLKKDLPDARLAAIPDCGHFLQEEKPEELSSLLGLFLAEKNP
ncbi:MAG TPA: alpha/beta hydrolase, partial [Candidatus Methanoperedens sp.]